MSYLCRVLRTLPCFFLLLYSCGGGSDVGNPDITGYVSYSSGKAASGGMVVLSKEGAAEQVDTTYAQQTGDFLLCFKTVNFDTVYCDVNGFFRFEEVNPGTYVLVAAKNGQLGMEKVSHSGYEESQTGLILENPASVEIQSYNYSETEEKFIAAHVSGTTFTAASDDLGTFTFSGIPSGDVEFVLYRADGTYEKYPEFTILPGCSASMTVDPVREPSLWVARECGPRDPLGIPYVIWSSPEKGAFGFEEISVGKLDYDVKIQFSHSMDTRSTGSAISAFSSDSLTEIESIRWQGANVVLVDLCVKDSTGECVPDSLKFKAGVTYTIAIDTTAQSDLGVNLTYPETIILKP
ncbi:MAG: carboxypeptidase regulatory-like domain-containing protein [Fibrobacter sp.]|nr:carboxypeptidase regulatory-like domain-containing protein [Fibrobacter sp.]